MSKKILSVVLALVLVMSASFTAFAATVGYEEKGTKNTQEWALSEPVDNGNGIWTVEVSLKANYPVGGIQFTIENTDNKNVVLTNAVAGAGIPANWKASVTKSNTTGKVAINPKPTDDAVDAITFGNETTGYTAKVVAILTYTVAEGGSMINIKNDPKTATTPGGTLIAARMSNGNVVTDADSPIVGQTVTSVGVTRNIGAAAQAKPELVLSNGVTVNKNYCNKDYTGVIFGFTTFGTAAYYRKSVTSTLGDDYIVIEANDSNKFGTGAVVKLVDSDKTTVLESYVVVIFGDVNGDGKITTTDTGYLGKNRGAISASTGPVKLAGNVNGDNKHAVTTADTGYLGKNRGSMASKQISIAATY